MSNSMEMKVLDYSCPKSLMGEVPYYYYYYYY